MQRYTIDTSFAAALIAIVLATVAGVLTAMFPSDVYPWVTAVVAGITAVAALVRQTFHVDEPVVGELGDDGLG